jgi:hypothetical protein
MAVSPPSKRELASWWKKFRKTNDKADEKGKRDFLECQSGSANYDTGIYPSL